MQSQFTDKAKTALLLAGRAAKSLHQNYVGTEHILLGLIKEGTGVASRVLTENGAKEEAIREMIQDLLAPETPNPVIERDGYSPRAEEVLEESHRQAEKAGSVLTGTEHILLALLGDGDNVAVRVLQTLSLPLQKIMRDTLLAAGLDPTAYREELGRRQKKSQTGTLELYSRDLTKLAAQGKLDPVVGRDQEIGRVIQILSRRTKNNPCLVGEPGVGKTAIVEGLALRITEGSVPDTVKDKRVLMLDLSGMIAGSKYRGEFEERIRKVIREVTDDGNILLFLDELHTLIGAGGAEGAIDASNILKPSLARGEIQLIGSPPGYVGFDEGGQLSEKVRRNPYSVVLFDEIEKAHPDVFNILLQVLDDGHITDSRGRKVSFKNTVIIMTSNAGAQRIVEPKNLGFAAKEDAQKTYEKMKSGVMEEVKRLFKPEFLNRIDETIVFHQLTKDDMKRIINLLAQSLITRCRTQLDISLTLTPSLKEHIVEKYSNLKMGARPLKRAIQTLIEDALAEEILSGRVKSGDHVSAGFREDKVVFSVKNK